MSNAKITLIGLYSYLQYDNIDLFENLILPVGIDKDTLVADILQKGSEFECQYANPTYMRESIKYWANKWYWTFDKWVKAINIEYSPLENYDRTEGWKDVTDKDTGNTRTFDNEDKTTLNNEDKRTLDTTNAAETQVSAFDSSTYQPSEKTTTDDDGTITDNHTGTITDDHSGTIKDAYNDDTTVTHEGRIHGNIGVTTSQQMLESELNIAYFNMYDRIADIFITEYCIPVYV